jgi:hypothetical protein
MVNLHMCPLLFPFVAIQIQDDRHRHGRKIVAPKITPFLDWLICMWFYLEHRHKKVFSFRECVISIYESYPTCKNTPPRNEGVASQASIIDGHIFRSYDKESESTSAQRVVHGGLTDG